MKLNVSLNSSFFREAGWDDLESVKTKASFLTFIRILLGPFSFYAFACGSSSEVSTVTATALVTCLESSPFRFTYHRQEWSPQNIAWLEMELQDLKLHCGVARDHRYLLTVYCVQAQLCGLCSYNFI